MAVFPAVQLRDYQQHLATLPYGKRLPTALYGHRNFKERFLSPQHPRRGEMDTFSAKLRKLGLDETTIGRGPLRPELDALLARRASAILF